MYRLLEVGEVMLEGDEVYGSEWCDLMNHNFNCRYNGWLPVRRKMEDSKNSSPSANQQLKAAISMCRDKIEKDNIDVYYSRNVVLGMLDRIETAAV
jgi:hypothetical protein